MAERWNMDAVEEFRRREAGGDDPLTDLQNEISGGEQQPPAAETASPMDGSDPLDSLQNQISSGEVISPTSGTGPFKSPSDYGTAIDPKGEQTRGLMEAESSGYGLGTVIRSGAQIAVPPTDEATAQIYNMIYPDLSTEQWYDVLRNRRTQYGKDWPKAKPVLDILGAGATGAAGVAALGAAGVPVGAAGLTGAALYSLGTSPWMPEKRVNEPGYAQEFATDAVSSVMGTYAGPGIGAAIAVPFKLLGKGAGKLSAKTMSWLAKDPETAASWKNFGKDSQRYKDIENPAQAVQDLYDDMTNALKGVKEARDTGRMAAQDAKVAYKDISSSVEKTLEAIKRRADELKLPPGGTAQKIEEHLTNFKKTLFGDGGLYDKAYDAMPSTDLWKQDPKTYGIPVKQYFNSMMESVTKNTSGVVHPEVNSLKSQAKNLFNFHVEKMADDAVEAGVMSTGAAEFFKRNPDVVLDPGLFKKLPKVVMQIGTPPNVQTINYVDVNGVRVPVDEIRQGYKFIANVNPQAMRKYTSTLFKLSDGFGSDKDIAEGAKNFLTSESGRRIAGDWRRNFLTALSTEEKFPEFKDFARLNKEAFDINDTFLKPLEARFTIRGSNQEATTRALATVAGNFEPQILNSIKEMARYGNNNDQTLVHLAEKIGAAQKAASNIGQMDVESAIKTMYELGELQDEATKVLSGLDPVIRNQLSHLETRVLEAGDKQTLWKDLAKKAEDFAKNNKIALSTSYGGVESALKKMAGNRASFTAKPSQISAASDSIKNIQTFMNNGDENAANVALDQMKRLREIALMNKRVVTGSRQTIQAGALAKVAAGTARLFGFNVDTNMAAATGAVMNKFADEFTSKKWTSVTPYLIGKMMEGKIWNYKNTLGRGLLSGEIARAMGDSEYLINMLPGSADAMKVIDIIKADNKLTPVEKHKAIKKINEDGIKL
jgi:hypothetical protein